MNDSTQGSNYLQHLFIEGMWKEILRNERDKLINATDETPALYECEKTYRTSLERFDGYDGFDREYAETFDNPLSALKNYADAGVTPPPELITVISMATDAYLYGEKYVPLETILLGKSIRKLGNYKAQKKRKVKYTGYKLAFFIGGRKGKSQLQVAEEIVEKENLSIEPESLLREILRYTSDDK